MKCKLCGCVKLIKMEIINVDKIQAYYEINIKKYFKSN